MKTVFVLRHAQAKDGSLFIGDKERQLSATGITQITIVANNFKEKLKLQFNAIITSNAARTVTTANLFAQAINTNNIQANPLLYNAPIKVFYEVLLQLPNEISSVLIVAHNPGITHFVNSLGIATLDNMPTSGLFGFTVACKEWNSFLDAKKDFLYFDSPKTI
jgi:phosphohistidine phosphatase